jgi:acetyl-CoA C-acetyltransferase
MSRHSICTAASRSPCFVCDATGLATDDARGLTLTGGLPYFGGPGNSYSPHAIAETVCQMRDKPGQFGLVGANGGVMTKYSVGVYSTDPAEWAADRSTELQARIAALPEAAVTRDVNGQGVIETYSVRYDWPARTGVIVGRLDDGSRFMATTTDADLVALMSDEDPLGQRISVTAVDGVNRATL